MQDRIIHFLKKNEGYLSGEEISRHLKISRAAIWKYIQELRQEGYEIVAVPHLGYRLVSSPDKLFPREVQFKLGTQLLGKKILYYDSLTSTMDIAFQLGVEGIEEGAVICAENQTKGKGRFGRSWSSPKGKGIYMSVILRPKLAPSDVAQLTLLSAVAVCEAIKKVSGVAAMIKWPNDIWVKNKKLGGILTELSADMDRVRFVVVGIGINVNTPLNVLPAHSTTLKNEISAISGKQHVSRIELIQEVLRSLENWYEAHKANGFIPVIERWKQLSLTLGTRIRVVDSGVEIEGEAVDLDEYGGLVIRNDAGMMIQRMAGDIIQVR